MKTGTKREIAENQIRIQEKMKTRILATIVLIFISSKPE